MHTLSINLFEKNPANATECISLIPYKPTFLESLAEKIVIGLALFRQYYVEFYFKEVEGFLEKRMKFAKIKS